MIDRSNAPPRLASTAREVSRGGRAGGADPRTHDLGGICRSP
jgi:hypothetical protein